MGQERLDRAAQQGRVMARHRRDDQKLRLARAGDEIRPDEMEQIAERPRPHDLLEDRVDRRRQPVIVQPKRRLAVAARHALEQFRAGGDVLAEQRVGERVEGIVEHEMRRVGHGARRRESGVRHLVELIGIGWGHGGRRSRARELARST